jgi:hypothetical protein
LIITGNPSLRRFQARGQIADRLAAAAQHGHARLASDLASTDLVAQLLQRVDARADEGDPRFGARLGKRRTLRQEPVTRVNGIDAVLLGQRDDRLDVQIGPDRLA